MNILTKEQVEEINNRINALEQSKVIKVNFDGTDHYISDVSENGATYIDGSTFEGNLNEMVFLDFSPDDGCDFDDLSDYEFGTFLIQIYDDSNIVNVIILITELEYDVDEDTNDETIELLGSLCGKDYIVDPTLEHCNLYGYVYEKNEVDFDNTEYIVAIKYNQDLHAYEIDHFNKEALEEMKKYGELAC